jgi:hypothetical protein
MNNLATIFHSLNILPKNPSIAVSMDNLAGVLESQNRL